MVLSASSAYIFSSDNFHSKLEKVIKRKESFQQLTSHGTRTLKPSQKIGEGIIESNDSCRESVPICIVPARLKSRSFSVKKSPHHYRRHTFDRRDGRVFNAVYASRADVHSHVHASSGGGSRVRLPELPATPRMVSMVSFLLR